jgi:hypothetical protein
MATDLNIFDNYGNVDQAKITPEVIATLTDDECTALMALMDADKTAKAAESRAAEARKRHGEAAKAHKAASDAYIKLVPPITQADLIRQNIGYAPKPQSVEQLKKIATDLHQKAKKASEAASRADTDEAAAEAKAVHAETVAKADAALVAFTAARDIEAAKIARDKLAEELTAVQTEYTIASAAVKPARVAQSDGISAFIKLTKKLTPLDVARDYQRRSAEQAMAKAAAAANPAPEHRTWPIETALAARKDAMKASRAGRYASAPRRLA